MAILHRNMSGGDLLSGLATRLITIGSCGYAEPADDGEQFCCKSGVRFTVVDVFGHLHSIVRCQQHGDWRYVLRAQREERPCNTSSH